MIFDDGEKITEFFIEVTEKLIYCLEFGQRKRKIIHYEADSVTDFNLGIKYSAHVDDDKGRM